MANLLRILNTVYQILSKWAKFYWRCDKSILAYFFLDTVHITM